MTPDQVQSATHAFRSMGARGGASAGPLAGKTIAVKDNLVQRGVSGIVAKGDSVSATLDCTWLSPSGQDLVRETRRLTFHDLPRGELALDLDMSFEAVEKPVVEAGEGYTAAVETLEGGVFCVVVRPIG